MLVKIKKIHPNAILPTKGTDGAACYDIYALEDTYISVDQVARVRTGLAFEIPKGYEMEIRSRSGLASRGVIITNSPGTLDSDFRGELLILLSSIDIPYEIKAGDRIAQFKINRVLPVEFQVVDKLSSTTRGENGYGSTGR
jgi:dUTP pyrophosphatase